MANLCKELQLNVHIEELDSPICCAINNIRYTNCDTNLGAQGYPYQNLPIKTYMASGNPATIQ